MSKFKKFVTHPQIKAAFLLGFAVAIGIVAQAIVFKKIYHIEVKGLFLIIPGLIFAFYEALSLGKENKNKKYLKTVYWFWAIILANIIVILIPLL